MLDDEGWNCSSQVSLLEAAAPTEDKEKELREMQRLLRVNCLNRGKYKEVKGSVWVLGFDGTPSSQQALREILLRRMAPGDHLWIACFWREPLPIERGWLSWPDSATKIRARYERWQHGRERLLRAHRIISRESPETLREERVTLYFAPALDARRKLCALAREVKARTLVIAKHRDPDKAEREKNNFLRSCVRYCRSYAPCAVLVL